ncbi:hypothetical protein EI94DRAFT_1813094 [Lactarius quietus]|nr:hypothetical protein EI94DRAFT_1813094 [Lactarius quietus]
MAFLRANIHELLAPDLLYQIITGAFKDYVVTWVEKYILQTYPKAQAECILADIDRRIAVVPSFPGLRHFYQGRGFKQWTGDDSKGLMKVYLPAIAGHVPAWMVQAVAALINFCYLVRRNVIDEDTLTAIDHALHRFHDHREIFHDLGVSPEGFSFPRLHSMVHYSFLITQFGAPNGLCSSITKSKHIKTIKHTIRRSNGNKALGQMLVTNQQVDKLAAACVDFTSRGMLDGPNMVENGASAAQPNEDGEDIGAIDDMVDEPELYSEITLAKTYVHKLPRNVHALARFIRHPNLSLLSRCFLYAQLHPESPIPASQIAEHELPPITSKVYVHTSVRAVFYAPSDLSGLGGLRHEQIHSTSSWYGGPAHRDCVFVGNSDLPDAPGISGTTFLPSDPDFTFDKSLDVFQSFYVNKYVDHHAHEIAF